MSDPSLARRLAGSDFRRADTLRDERSHEHIKGIELWLGNLAGWLPPVRLRRRRINAFDTRITAAAAELKPMAQADIVQRFQQAVKALKTGDDDELALAQLFACIGEASRRTLGYWPHPVQFTGARVLLQGRLAEMQTGEGKTLVAALAATAMAGSGASVQVISTNDYLAERDSTETAPLFQFFGLSTAFIKEGMEPEERQAAYRHSVCYVCGKELVFDYLKDRLAGHGMIPTKVAQLRGLFAVDAQQSPPPLLPALHFAIVDEADSVLIDEARTPMIISREAPGLYEPDLLSWAITAAGTLEENRDFVRLPGPSIELKPEADARVSPVPATVSAVWRVPSWRRMILRQALTALHLFHRDQHYILVEGKVQIVDESTGRVMPDRSWEQGLHQLIEAKEQLELSNSRETLERMTFQRFFRRYYLLSGLTGTAAEAHRELWSVYRLEVCRIPPNRPNRRRLLDSRCVPNLAQKWQRVADDACAAAARGQPVLVGTRSVEASEQVTKLLRQRGVDHVVLNARQDTEEADVVSAAGLPGRITVATNMAGRGTDIKLQAHARESGGLHVILTEFHESPRVDRQLFGRSGRQGDPGSARAIVSAADALFTQEVPMLSRLLQDTAWPAWLQRFLLRGGVWFAQQQAERRAYRTRLQTLKQDRDLSKVIGFAGKTQ